MDWLLSFGVILGNYLIGKKNKWGWIVMIIGAIGWIFYALSFPTPQYGLIPASVLNLIIASKSFIRWFKDDKNASTVRI